MFNKNTALSLLGTLMRLAGLPSQAAEPPGVGSTAPGFRLQDQSGRSLRAASRFGGARNRARQQRHRDHARRNNRQCRQRRLA